MMCWHRWFVYKYKGSTYKRCNKCGLKQYRWHSWDESGWENMYTTQEKIDNIALKEHIAMLLDEIKLLRDKP